MNEHSDLFTRLTDLAAEVRALTEQRDHFAGLFDKQVAETKRHAFCVCTYCEKRIVNPVALGDNPGLAMQHETVAAHMRVCPQHPMRLVEAERDAALRDVAGVRDKLDESAAMLTATENAHIKTVGVELAWREECHRLRTALAAADKVRACIEIASNSQAEWVRLTPGEGASDIIAQLRAFDAARLACAPATTGADPALCIFDQRGVKAEPKTATIPAETLAPTSAHPAPGVTCACPLCVPEKYAAPEPAREAVGWRRHDGDGETRIIAKFTVTGWTDGSWRVFYTAHGHYVAGFLSTPIRPHDRRGANLAEAKALAEQAARELTGKETTCQQTTDASAGTAQTGTPPETAVASTTTAPSAPTGCAPAPPTAPAPLPAYPWLAWWIEQSRRGYVEPNSSVVADCIACLAELSALRKRVAVPRAVLIAAAEIRGNPFYNSRLQSVAEHVLSVAGGQP